MNSELKKCEEEFEMQEQERLKIERLLRGQKNFSVENEQEYQNGDKMEEEKPKIQVVNSEGKPIESLNSNKEQEKPKWNQKDLYKSFEEEIQEFNEVKESITMKNLRLFYITLMFSTDYSKFIASLIGNNEQFEQQNAMMIEKSSNNENEEEKSNMMEMEDHEGVKYGRKSGNRFENLFDFVCSVYFTTIIRMNDIKIQHQFFEWLCEKMEKVTYYYSFE